MTPRALLSSLLRDVSRSFYLTLRLLPGRIRPQVGLAYLLARATDTIADTGLVPLQQRAEALRAFSERILGRRPEPVDLGALAAHQGTPAERKLLEQCEAAIGLLESFSEPDRYRIRQVLETITSGQELDLLRFGRASAKQVVALTTEAELDDYAYRVAGCVGEFWTRMCRAHLFPSAAIDEQGLLADGVRFGKGLQLVNILRDIPADLRKGRCYLPAEELAAVGLGPQDLLDAAQEQRLRPCYDKHLDLADSHLAAGWIYTNTLPRRCVRVRLACALPLLVGRETTALLRSGAILDPQHRIKVPRAQVKSLLWRSVLYYPWPSAWRALFPQPVK